MLMFHLSESFEMNSIKIAVINMMNIAAILTAKSAAISLVRIAVAAIIVILSDHPRK